MSQSNNNSDDPLFIMHIGATYAVRISVLHGSSHGLMALPVHGVVRVRLQGGRGNDAQEVDVSTLSEEIGKWEGFGIWDTSTHAQPLADRPAQQIKADLTFKLRMKVSCSTRRECTLWWQDLFESAQSTSILSLCALHYAFPNKFTVCSLWFPGVKRLLQGYAESLSLYISKCYNLCARHILTLAAN